MDPDVLTKPAKIDSDSLIQARQLEDRDGKVFFMMSEVYKSMGQMEKAQELLEKAHAAGFKAEVLKDRKSSGFWAWLRNLFH